jgi:hypothetical protein
VNDIINQIDGNVQVIFEIIPDVGYPYRDALWFTQEVYDTITQEEINTMKQQRFDNYLAMLALSEDLVDVVTDVVTDTSTVDQSQQP